MKFYHHLTLFVALIISACAAYYSIVGLTAIFAAAVLPIVVMGSALELAKIVGAVWLKIYWRQAGFMIKLYLVPAVGVLMLITSMGIFGFLSKAHIEQTASAAEGVAQIERIDTEIARQQDIVARAEVRITEAENSTVESNAGIQSQIDAEQARIDSAYNRIQPAIDEQLQIIEQARADADSRLQPYRDQLASVEAELLRLEEQAAEIESRISSLGDDSTAVNDLLTQIAAIEETVARVNGQLTSRDPDQIRTAQTVIGVTRPDGIAGANTRNLFANWAAAQQDRIARLQTQITEARAQAQQNAAAERERLTDLVANIRGEQSDRLRTRRDNVLATIEELQNQEPLVVTTARDEIARIRASADQQVAASQELIQRLRDSLTVGEDADTQLLIDQQLERIATANNTIDQLTEQKYELEAAARALEAEVGPIKYVAELIYGDADTVLLEEAVRWMIVLLVIVFDPLAVILTLAAVSGLTGFGNQKKSSDPQDSVRVERVEVPVEVEKIVEVEKPVEVIREVEVPVEVEKIVEVEKPVEVIREVEKIVEVEVPVEDNDKVNELAQEVEDLLDTIQKQKDLIKKLKQDQKVRNQPVAEPDFDLGDVSGASFGSTWPIAPTKGQMFLKVDVLPNKLYKWNGRKWIEVDTDRIADTLAYDEKYIQYLLREVKQGRREYDELSEVEQNQIKNYIRVHGNNEDTK